MDVPDGQATDKDPGNLPPLPRGHSRWPGYQALPEMITGEQGAGKLASPVREETDGKGPGQGHLVGGRLHSLRPHLIRAWPQVVIPKGRSGASSAGLGGRRTSCPSPRGRMSSTPRPSSSASGKIVRSAARWTGV